MDQIKIGRFIADERKRKGYTQKQLSEKLNISDKTISKWERGNGFPEVSLLLPLCNELEITVNELLSGERVSEEDYQKKAEENMVNLVREAQESKKKIIIAAIIAFFGLLASMPLFIIAELGVVNNPTKIVLIVIGVIVLFGGIIIACILDNEAGAFECPECKSRFVPDMKSYIMGPHTIIRRKLVCPCCGAHKYCKKVLTRH
ncbi:MAG: helix-turn-helix domain-containing protein [Lachnospiraceae bacterium]